MSGLMKEDLRSLLYLISLGIVGAVTIGVFFGMGFMGLTDPRRPVAPRADPILPAQAVKEDEFPPRGDKDAVQGSSPVFYVEKVAGSPAPDAPVNQAGRTLRSTGLETSLMRHLQSPTGNLSASVGIATQERGDIGSRNGGLMRAPDPTQAGVFTDLQTSMSDT